MHRATKRIPGHDVDRVDVAAGLRELTACGYNAPETVMVIEYALMRWARGEEEAAQRGAIDRNFHGINLTSWIRVLAAARASAEAAAVAAGKLALCADSVRLTRQRILDGNGGACPGCGRRVHNRGWGSHARSARLKLAKVTP